MSKQKQIRRNKIANLGYVVIETKSECNKTVQKEFKSRHWTFESGEGDPLVIAPMIVIEQYEQVGDGQPKIRPVEWDTRISLGFWDPNRSPKLGQKTNSSDSQQKWN